jgi:hypothetical protein
VHLGALRLYRSEKMFKGMLREMRIYNRALSALEIVGVFQ